MESIENAWKVPLSTGGIFKIVVNENNIELYRIFSGKYISDELKLKKDIEYIDSLIVPGATDPVEPEDLFNRIKNMVKKITAEYYANSASKMEEISGHKTAQQYEMITLTDVKKIEISDFNDEKFPELTINSEKFLLPFENFTQPTDKDIKRYNQYNIIVEALKNKIL
jgi:hypothetical protein